MNSTPAEQLAEEALASECRACGAKPHEPCRDPRTAEEIENGYHLGRVPIPPKMPECEKRTEIIRSGRPAIAQEFLDWLLYDQGVRFYTTELYEDYDGSWHPMPYRRSPEEMMAAFFGIDQKKIDQEQRELLAYLQSRQP